MIAKIVRITPDGAAFTTANGTFYPYQVGLDDRTSGQANSKSNPPPWRVGEIVGYAVTGQTPRGANKLKITRNPDTTFGQYQPPAQDTSNPDLEAAAPLSSERMAQHAPAPQPARQVARNADMGNPRTGEGQHDGLPVNLPNGATVGGALARAVDIWKFLGGSESAWDSKALDQVERITRDLVEIQGRIERGEPPANEPF